MDFYERCVYCSFRISLSSESNSWASECHGAYPVGVVRQNGVQWIVTIVAPKPYSWNEASR